MKKISWSMKNVIECKNLTHYYGKKMVFENLNFAVEEGSIFGLLGKNGTGKTTTINILSGFLRPSSGQCFILGEETQQLQPATKAKIGFLMEGHVQYSFMNVRQIEKFYSGYYPNWNRTPYFELLEKLGIGFKQKVSQLSCGQRSMVALGLILAQDPEIMILDDYSMGLDPGYRRLFLDYLQEYAKAEHKTILLTSHIIQDLEHLIDNFIILGYRNILLESRLDTFMREFKQFKFELSDDAPPLKTDKVIRNFEKIKNQAYIYTFESEQKIIDYLKQKKIKQQNLRQIPMSLEDAFIGLTGLH